jgi:hypothetical protein
MAIAYRFRVKTLRDDHPCSPEQATALREALCERISDLRHGAPHELEPAERRAVRALVRDVRHACALIDHARRVNRETPLRQFLRWSRSELGSQVEGVYAHAAFEILRSMPDPAKFVPAELLHPDQEAMLGGRLYLHQMFGHASSPQDATSEYADHVLLLQIGGSPTLGLPLMGSAAMHYWITREDLARGRFDRVHGTWEAG